MKPLTDLRNLPHAVSRLSPAGPILFLDSYQDWLIHSQHFHFIQVMQAVLTDHFVFDPQVIGDDIHQDQIAACKMSRAI